MHFGGPNSLKHLASFLHEQALDAYKSNIKTIGHGIGQAIEDRAKAAIGNYQPSVGPYPAWAPLTESTLASKASHGWGMGGNPDTPLYATGEFQKSISHEVSPDGFKVVAGSTKPEALYTELGTSQMPPRPVFGPVAMVVVSEFLPQIARLSGAGIAGTYVRTFPQSRGFGQVIAP